MKKSIMFAVAAIGLAGCASVRYETDSGNKLSYTRIGVSNLEGLELTDGVRTVKLSKASSHLDAENVAAISAAAIQAAKAAQ
jgi:uncharacterized protein YceK